MKNFVFVIMLAIFAMGCASKQEKDKSKNDKDPIAATDEKLGKTDSPKVKSVCTEPTMTAIERDSICEGLSSWEKECHDRIENYIIKTHGDWVSRDGETLSLSIENGEDLSFTSNRDQMSIENYVGYSLYNYYPAIDAYVVLVTYYEGITNLIINRKSGNSIDVVGDIAVSPDQKRFVVYNKDMETTYTFNGFHVFRVNGNSYEQEHKEGLEWGPRNARWLSNTEIEFEKITSPYDEAEPDGKAVYELVDDKWVAQ